MIVLSHVHVFSRQLASDGYRGRQASPSLLSPLCFRSIDWIWKNGGGDGCFPDCWTFIERFTRTEDASDVEEADRVRNAAFACASVGSSYSTTSSICQRSQFSSQTNSRSWTMAAMSFIIQPRVRHQQQVHKLFIAMAICTWPQGNFAMTLVEREDPTQTSSDCRSAAAVTPIVMFTFSCGRCTATSASTLSPCPLERPLFSHRCFRTVDSNGSIPAGTGRGP